ncbi:MAG: TonB-dependent receptor, partial [Proteobacteria bacterium]|nr:TonB-dependent receptor [Pseudomonadota bacterium]
SPTTLTYSPHEALSFTWTWDWQPSQEIQDSDFLLNDPDNRRAEHLEAGDFHQHDFSVRYDVVDQVTLRAGVTNALDAEPVEYIQSNIPNRNQEGSLNDVFDFLRRRFFIGANPKFGAARD